MGKAKHRLKKKDLIMNIFALFSEEYEKSKHKSIWDIVISIEYVIEYLKEKCEVDYKSSLWLWTQMKRYEEELGVKLFRKVKKNDKEFSIAIHYPFKNFFQKQHLYVTEKIKVANGVYDLLQNLSDTPDRRNRLRIILGAGTLCYHLSTILADHSWNSRIKYLIHTNNLGALEQLIIPGINNENIRISIPEGVVDPVTQTIIGENNAIYSDVEFDFIIQGTSYVYNGNLYIESGEESLRKHEILKKTKGKKILVLTKREFTDKLPDGMSEFGNIKDYDYAVIPKKSTDSTIKKKCESIFEQYSGLFIPQIINWNYEILKVNNNV
ncbi:MAG: hypothetical protein DRP59_07465 [Spirochaetes bacterium]|nr:MAG: hypothetical protein DRP59_07465 [Spirochaetota bacterium]